MGSGRSISIYIALVFILSLQRQSNVAIGTFYPDERRDLIELRDNLSSSMNLHSIWTGPPCYGNKSQWFGIACFNFHVVGISLGGIQLTGSLQPSSLQSLAYLTNLNLSNNVLYGQVPTLQGLNHLRAVSLSINRFSGSIPVELASLRELSQLELQDNLLNGTIPPFDQQSLVVFNVSYNFLEGKIPTTPVLQRFPNSSFDHNSELCGTPLHELCPVAPPPPPPPPLPAVSPVPSPSSSSKELKLWSLVLIVVGALMVPFLVIMCFLCYYKSHHTATRKRDSPGDVVVDIAEKSTGGIGSSGEPDRTAEMEFFDKKMPAFNLDDLLRSSAEMMGKGQIGNTYRVTQESGQVVMVKRMKEMAGVSKKDFVQQMQLVGKMKHENLVEVISFYYSKNEKMVIYEHINGGSLFQLLHDNRGGGRVPLKWPARLNIVKGIARGLAYLHQSLPSHKVPHANLKTSNVLIQQETRQGHQHYQAKLTDFGFLPLFSSPPQAKKLAAGRAPEFLQGKKLTHKVDIFCFGLVLLEVITGQVPGDEEEDLSEWVRSAVTNEWSTDILDLEIVAEKEGHEEMLEIVDIALGCTAMEPERRPKMSELLKRIEEIREGSNEQRD